MKNFAKRRHGGTFCLLFFLFAIYGPLIRCVRANESSQPNIVVVIADDMGWGDVSFNGNGNLSTPCIDRLALSGVVFNSFCVQPVCSPSRAEILTGRYAVRGGVSSTSQGGERLDLDETTIGDICKTAGYRTGFFGKWHNGSQYPYHPNGRGFDEFYGFCAGHWGNYINPVLERNDRLVRGNGFLPNDLTEQAMNFMERDQKVPFFLFLSLNTPHSPMQMPDELWARFKNNPLEFRGSGREKENLDHTRAALAFCENIDANVGRLYEKLVSLEASENTIFLFLSDNGPNGPRWNNELKGIKGSVDEGGVRVPAFIHWPAKIKKGRTIDQLASGIDLVPTLCDLAGIKIKGPASLDGISLEKCILDSNAIQDRFVYNFWRNRLSVRNTRFRISEENKLFDLVEDPTQTTDIAKQHPLIFERLSLEKNRWMNEIACELPSSDERRFPVGHKDFDSTILPARDAHFVGEIERSNRWPNCSFLTNWSSTNDEIKWPIEVLESGFFEPTIYYTCPIENIGGVVALAYKNNSVTREINVPFESDFLGKEFDRYPREESYMKEFRQLKMNKIRLQKGTGSLVLTAKKIPGGSLMDFRRLVLKRVK